MAASIEIKNIHSGDKIAPGPAAGDWHPFRLDQSIESANKNTLRVPTFQVVVDVFNSTNVLLAQKIDNALMTPNKWDVDLSGFMNLVGETNCTVTARLQSDPLGGMAFADTATDSVYPVDFAVQQIVSIKAFE